MHRTTAAKAYGLGYHQALLAQSEDDIVTPKRSPNIQKNIQQTRCKSRSYCQEMLQTPLNPQIDPIERLCNVRLRDLQVFLK